MKIHVYSTLAKLVVKEENPDPIHHTQTLQTHKHKMTVYMIKINEPQLPWLRTAIYHTGLDVKMEHVYRTPGCPALRTEMVG